MRNAVVKVCSFDGCGKRATSKGMCRGHYCQFVAGKKLAILKHKRCKNEQAPLCSFEGCGRVAITRGLCPAHYHHFQRKRELIPIHSTQRPKLSDPVIEYDEQQCQREDLNGPCHIFRGNKRSGYGRISLGGKSTSVHRYVWKKERGPIPKNKVIDHQCRNRACCNVDHLRLVTRKINSTENIVGAGWQINAAKTHCPKGHPYDSTNTRYDNGRRCIVCLRQRNRINYENRKKKRK